MCFNDVPLNNELPSQYADRLGILYHKSVSGDHKKKNGQFFTSVEVAEYMASYVKSKSKKLRVLDPGCGIGILACTALQKIVHCQGAATEVLLTVFENDTGIIPYTEKVLVYLQEWLRKRNVHLTYLLCANDFILHNSSLLNNEEFLEEKFDIIIANPPYFKIPKNAPQAVAAKAIIYGQTNIYSIFLVIAAKLLSESGQLIFITPRSFSSGSYFRLFREIFFSLVELKNIHLFDSRKKAFERDQILQENIIIVATKREIEREKPMTIPFIGDTSYIEISMSKGINDINCSIRRKYLFKELVNTNSFQKILHLPSSETDEKAINLFKSWEGSLERYGIRISTGPVVDFRSDDFISANNMEDYVPLIWLNNIKPMQFTWPIFERSKGKEKGQYIKQCERSLSRLIPNRNYVFLRRFSSKDDKSRLVASPFFSEWLNNYEMLGIENHLNYVYKEKGELDSEEVIGISALLNSKLFDVYFRTFNGNINVSATELKEMPLPELDEIKDIGKQIAQTNASTNNINLIVAKTFKIDI